MKALKITIYAIVASLLGIGLANADITLQPQLNAIGSYINGIYTSALYVSGANIGIGSSTPSGTLAVDGTSASVPTTVIRSHSAQTADILQVKNSSNTALLNITSAGQVGVSTSSPIATLTASGTMALTNIPQMSDNSSASTYTFGMYGGTKGNQTLYKSGWEHSSHGDFFHEDLLGGSNSDSQPVLWIRNLFNGTSRVEYILTQYGNDGNVYNDFFGDSGQNAVLYSNILQASNQVHVNASANLTLDAITSCSGVGTEDLGTDSNGNVFCDNTPSDQALKADIQPMPNSTLQTLLNLNPVSFHWNNAFASSTQGLRQNISTSTEQQGLIAQEVAQVLPDLVSTTTIQITATTSEQVKTVDYPKLIPYLLKGIQEQQAEIVSLQSQVNVLTGRLNAAGIK